MSRVMLAGDLHPELYRRIAEKHADMFRRHLPALLLRREGDAVHVRRHSLDLELEQTRWMQPELACSGSEIVRLLVKQP